jgi:hypothetical protein
MTTRGLDEWYYRIGVLELGPVTFDELLNLAKTQQVSANDEVRLGNSGKWRQVGSIGRLMAALPFQSLDSRQTVRPAGKSSRATSQPSIRPGSTDPSSTGASSAANTTGRAKARRDTPVEPIGIRSESGVVQSRSSSGPVASVRSATSALKQEPEDEDEFLLRVEECLDRLNIPGNPRIGYETMDRVVTVRGTLSSEGERLLVLRRVGAVPGVARVVDSLTVVQADRRAPAPVTAATYRPVASKKFSRRSSGPGLIDRFKESLTGENRNHAVAIAVVTLVLGYWFFPRGPVRPVAVHPVKGRVIIDGEPLANAAIVLHRVDKQKSKLPANMFPRGKAEPDGTFALATFDRADGAPDGEFIATVFLVEEKLEPDGERSFGPNLLPAVYSRPESSPFKVTITSATKELEPLKLTRQ